MNLTDEKQPSDFFVLLAEDDLAGGSEDRIERARANGQRGEGGSEHGGGRENSDGIHSNA